MAPKLLAFSQHVGPQVSHKTKKKGAKNGLARGPEVGPSKPVEINLGKEDLWQLARSEEALRGALQDVAECLGSNFCTKEVVTKFLSSVCASGSQDLNHQCSVARAALAAAGYGNIHNLLDPLVLISQTLGRKLSGTKPSRSSW